MVLMKGGIQTHQVTQKVGTHVCGTLFCDAFQDRSLDNRGNCAGGEDAK